MNLRRILPCLSGAAAAAILAVAVFALGRWLNDLSVA